MKLRKKPEIYFAYEGPEIVISLERDEAVNVSDVIPNIDDIDITKDIEIKMSVKRKKRSLDANAYMWRLCTDIANVIRSTKEEVYREAIRQKGVYKVGQFAIETIESLKQIWESDRLGNYVEVSHESREIPGYVVVNMYYGSSMYNTKEMSHLIDYIVDEAKELGIETMTPDELARLKAAWGDDLTIEKRKT